MIYKSTLNFSKTTVNGDTEIVLFCSDAEVRPVANLIRLAMQRGLGGSPHERLHQDKENAPLRFWGFPTRALHQETIANISLQLL
ncbi:MAG: hypothetical protein F6K53_38205 [Moorea sp. SIO4A1]|uniref:hypothetical protein n=1 Tax=Moorena sp. SIO4A1 TaxID=2607835 RepID=UPI0014180573|nr:hypothetical protein [Moorena sp. SIO4A1]NEO51387.1 hypothetical protein [Moorena sp. SIO4A3]NEQ62886.1 hypothetical protein [Moorena sp. SIO4A1]